MVCIVNVLYTTCVETLSNTGLIPGGSWIFGHRKLVGGGVSWKGTGGHKSLHCSPVLYSLWDGQHCSTVRLHHVALLQHRLKVVKTFDHEHAQLKLWTKIKASFLYESHSGICHRDSKCCLRFHSFLACFLP